MNRKILFERIEREKKKLADMEELCDAVIKNKKHTTTINYAVTCARLRYGISLLEELMEDMSNEG